MAFGTRGARWPWGCSDLPAWLQADPLLFLVPHFSVVFCLSWAHRSPPNSPKLSSAEDVVPRAVASYGQSLPSAEAVLHSAVAVWTWRGGLGLDLGILGVFSSLNDSVFSDYDSCFS